MLSVCFYVETNFELMILCLSACASVVIRVVVAASVRVVTKPTSQLFRFAAPTPAPGYMRCMLIHVAVICLGTRSVETDVEKCIIG